MTYRPVTLVLLFHILVISVGYGQTADDTLKQVTIIYLEAMQLHKLDEVVDLIHPIFLVRMQLDLIAEYEARKRPTGIPAEVWSILMPLDSMKLMTPSQFYKHSVVTADVGLQAPPGSQVGRRIIGIMNEGETAYVLYETDITTKERTRLVPGVLKWERFENSWKLIP